MSKKEQTPTSSHDTKTWNRLSAMTRFSIEKQKSDRIQKELAEPAPA